RARHRAHPAQDFTVGIEPLGDENADEPPDIGGQRAEQQDQGVEAEFAGHVRLPPIRPAIQAAVPPMSPASRRSNSGAIQSATGASPAPATMLKRSIRSRIASKSDTQ